MEFLGTADKFKDQLISELSINDVKLLLVRQNDQFYLIENKCGHFGLPLTNAEIKQEEIICAYHGISFSLLTGEVVNRPYENCDKIRVFKVIQCDTGLYCDEAIN